MTIIDRNGKEITVTDLPAAIAQAAEYMGYRAEDPSDNTFIKRQNAYWQDVHSKLSVLQKKIMDDGTATEVLP